MLKPRIIPCLDVKDGRVVKGINFLNLIDAGDPVEQARYYNTAGADEICFLYIAASVENKKTIIQVIKNTAKEVFIPLTVGGGINTIEDIRNILLSGADKVSINSAAINNPNFVKEASTRFGSQCIVGAVDVKLESKNKWIIYSHGGTKKTNKDAIVWIKELQALGAGELLITSMDKDGTKTGFDNDFLKIISLEVNIPVIASGGAGELSHFKEAITIGCANAVLAASVFHFGKFSIKEVKQYLVDNNIPMRL